MGEVIIEKLNALSVSSGTDVMDTFTSELAKYVKPGQWGTVGRGALERMAQLLNTLGTDTRAY